MQLEDLTVLYAEDEKGIQDTVKDVLELYVDNVITANDGVEALELYNMYNPSILLLDICMPKKDGLEILKEIRQKDIKTPVIIMTAHTEKEYLMSAVELYITKYLVKPFDKNSLVDALNACLKVIENSFEEKLILSEGLVYNIEEQNIIKDDEIIHLNKKEILLINLLIKNMNRVITYEEIELHIWDDYVSKDALKSLIKDLRRKTSRDLIKNISGVGYKMEKYNVL